MGNVEGRSDREHTLQAGLEVLSDGNPGSGDRENLNLLTSFGTTGCAAPCTDPVVLDDAGNEVARVQLRPRGRVPGSRLTLNLNGGAVTDRELLDPAAFGAARVMVDEVTLRTLGRSPEGLQEVVARLYRNGSTLIAALPLDWLFQTNEVGTGAVMDLATVTWVDVRAGGAAQRGGGKVAPGTVRIRYTDTGATPRTITDDGAGNLVGDVVGGTIDYATGVLAGTTSQAVLVAANPAFDWAFNHPVGHVKRYRAGMPVWPTGLVVAAPDTLTGGTPGGSTAGIHQAQLTALGRVDY